MCFITVFRVWYYHLACNIRFGENSISVIGLYQEPGGLPYEKFEDVYRKIWVKPLKENNPGVALALFNP